MTSGSGQTGMGISPATPWAASSMPFMRMTSSHIGHNTSCSTSGSSTMSSASGYVTPSPQETKTSDLHLPTACRSDLAWSGHASKPHPHPQSTSWISSYSFMETIFTHPFSKSHKTLTSTSPHTSHPKGADSGDIFGQILRIH